MGNQLTQFTWKTYVNMEVIVVTDELIVEKITM